MNNTNNNKSYLAKCLISQMKYLSLDLELPDVSRFPLIFCLSLIVLGGIPSDKTLEEGTGIFCYTNDKI